MRKLLLIIIISSICIINADGTPPLGDGSEINPYQIESLDNLLWVSTNQDVWSDSIYFQQTQDIDATDTENWNDGQGFDPIGEDFSHSFRGIYLGGNHIIDGLYINRSETDDVGLFGFAYNATIMDLGITNANIQGNEEVGGIAGQLFYSSVNNSFVTGEISGSNEVGGLVGFHYLSSLTNCYCEVSITADSFMGCLAGRNLSSIITNSYYDYQTSTINSLHQITAGALPMDLYVTWQDNNMLLNVEEYLSFENGSYSINNVDDLEFLLYSAQIAELSYSLNNDIDLFEKPGFFIPYFTGTFIGNGYSISNLNIDNPNSSILGFLGYVLDSEIQDLYIDNASVTGDMNIGSLIGSQYNSTTTRCWANGSVYGNDLVGGLIGRCNNSTVSECYADCVVYGEYNAGGLVGINYDSSLITNSYARGEVSGYRYSGGLLGSNNQSTISNCYAAGFLDGTSYYGGLIGFHYNSELFNCVWNTETAGTNYGYGENFGSSYSNMLGRSTAVMQTMELYTGIGWDFAGESVNGDEDIWDFNSINDGFPVLSNLYYNVDNNDNEISEANEVVMSNYPNPFNPSLNIEFSIKEAVNSIELVVYNIAGQKVKTFNQKDISAGTHKIIWNGKNSSNESVASGLYFFNLILDGKSEAITKSILIK